MPSCTMTAMTAAATRVYACTASTSAAAASRCASRDTGAGTREGRAAGMLDRVTGFRSCRGGAFIGGDRSERHATGSARCKLRSGLHLGNYYTAEPDGFVLA